MTNEILFNNFRVRKLFPLGSGVVSIRIGERGETSTPLYPTGRVTIASQSYDARADHGAIECGMGSKSSGVIGSVWSFAFRWMVRVQSEQASPC